jgi:hypothetical protein
MSLLRLLSAGKSLMGVKDADSPYRMTTQNLLPKFGSAKNPFAPTPKSEPPPYLPDAVPAPASESPSSEPAHLETIPLFEAKTAQAATRARVTAADPAMIPPKEPAQPAKQADVFTTVVSTKKPVVRAKWAAKINPISYLLRGRSSAKKPVNSKTAKSPVQTELSLEKVKVIRNELHDSDLELIPRRMGGLRKKNEVVPPAAGKAYHTKWERLTSRIFREGQTQIR